jgi:hypothetical protein
MIQNLISQTFQSDSFIVKWQFPTRTDGEHQLTMTVFKDGSVVIHTVNLEKVFDGHLENWSSEASSTLKNPLKLLDLSDDFWDRYKKFTTVDNMIEYAQRIQQTLL